MGCESVSRGWRASLKWNKWNEIYFKWVRRFSGTRWIKICVKSSRAGNLCVFKYFKWEDYLGDVNQWCQKEPLRQVMYCDCSLSVLMLTTSRIRFFSLSCNSSLFAIRPSLSPLLTSPCCLMARQPNLGPKRWHQYNLPSLRSQLPLLSTSPAIL